MSSFISTISGLLGLSGLDVKVSFLIGFWSMGDIYCFLFHPNLPLYQILFSGRVLWGFVFLILGTLLDQILVWVLYRSTSLCPLSVFNFILKLNFWVPSMGDDVRFCRGISFWTGFLGFGCWFVDDMWFQNIDFNTSS